jgi:uncharacterized protein
MRCPLCKRETTYEGNPYRPFCSKRCKLLDLDNWLEGRYRIPDAPADEDNRGEENPEEGPDENGG